VQQLFSGAPRTSRPGDRSEREADRVARSVTGVEPGPAVDSRPWPEVTPGEVPRASGPGQLLDPGVRSEMEGALGTDLSAVRVHTGPSADLLTRSIGAAALTTGNDLFFRSGEYAPTRREGRALLAHELTHVVQQQPTDAGPVGEHVAAGTVQPFWVRSGNQVHWVGDKTKKGRYVQTAETRSSFLHPATRHVRVAPWESGGSLSFDTGFAEDAEISGASAELQMIHSTQLGSELLMALAQNAPDRRTSVMPQPRLRGALTNTEKTKSGLTASISFTPGDYDMVAALRATGQKVQEPNWNPTPGDAALFHELVHAYHNLAGTKATGPVTADDAVHEGDIGIAMSEYQAVGLDSVSDERHQYSGEHFSENAYRAERGYVRRDSYTPRPSTKKKGTKKKATKKKAK
jgi:hypothetical protein